MLSEPAYNNAYFLAKAPPRCPSSLRCSVFLEDARKCYVSCGFWRVSVCIVRSSNHKRPNGNTFPKYGILLLVWNVTVANGFWWFPNNRKIFALASRVPLARTVPHQGWALEMQGIPMVFNLVQLIPRSRQGSIHSAISFLMMIQMGKCHCSHWFLTVFC